MNIEDVLQLLIAQQRGLQLAIGAVAGSLDPASLASAQASLQKACIQDSIGMDPKLAEATRTAALAALVPLDD